jgi:hypothetical protein
MQALRLNEVLTRVVAWHNRHPLARRIGPSQVHSIGEVVLPFASAQPLKTLSAPPPPAPPVLTELLAPAPSALPVLLTEEDDTPAFLPVEDGEFDSRPPTDGEASPEIEAGSEGEAALDMPALDALDEPGTSESSEAGTQNEAAETAPSDTAAAADDATEPVDVSSMPEPEAPASQDAAPASALADAANPGEDQTQHPEPNALPAEDQHGHAPAPANNEQAPAQPAPDQDLHHVPDAIRHPAPAAKSGNAIGRWFSRLLGRRTDLPKLQSVFSRNFIWPLSPSQVARWARRHGQAEPVAPPDWPRRVVESDFGSLAAARSKGMPHNASLHVLTAAIGVGDRRMRVLIGADGAIIGPRAYSKPRVAVASTLAILAIGAAGWGQLKPLWPERAADGPEVAAAAASAPASAAASEPALAASEAASAVAHAEPPASVASAPVVAASHAEPPPVAMAHASPPPASAPADEPHQGSAQASAPTEEAASTPRALGRIKPDLSDEQKLAARAQSQAARDGKAAAKPAAASEPTVLYALVTRPTAERDFATSGLTMMRKATLYMPPPVPHTAELMRSGKEWRAVWWPFTTLADAERARIMLASKGLKVEVIEL